MRNTPTSRCVADEALPLAEPRADARPEARADASGRRRGADRRVYSLETLRRSVVAPRRTAARRGEDRRFPVLDRFEPGLLALAVALLGLSILDSTFTLMLLAAGGSEVNPFMNWVLGHGVVAFAVVKMALTAVPAVLLVATANVPVFGVRPRSVLAAFVGLYAGLICYELALLASI